MALRQAVLPIFAFILILAAASAFAQEADKVQCYSTWDENYFYFAAQISCQDIQSTHIKPNDDVTGDDSVTIYLDTGADRGSTVDAQCYSMTVTAGGGSEFRAGSDTGTLEPVKAFSFKYGINLQGTINNNDDSDIGYSVEIALPWSLLKAQPPLSGGKMGYNVVVRRHGGKPNDFVSLAPAVTAEIDTLNPSKWSSIIFGPYSFVAATTNVEKILSIRYIARMPLIDGTLADKEWHKNTSVAIAFPNVEGPAPEIKFSPQKLVFALYDISAQCDPKRPGFTDCLSRVSRLSDFPPYNVGPWYSSDRVQWHKDMLAGMAAAGVDVALPIIRSDAGLAQMIAAIRELVVEGQHAPQLAPCIDTAALATDLPKKMTLNELLYDFYSVVPPEMRAITQTGLPTPGHVAYTVFLLGSVAQADLPADFMGRPIVWIAPADVTSDGVIQRAGVSGGKSFADSRIKTAVISPGYDNTGTAAAGNAEIAARMGGSRYDTAWQNSLRSGPHWIILDSWNSYLDGTELAESRQYGKAYIDKTRENVSKFRAAKDFDVNYARVDAPETIAPGAIVLAEFTLTNVGNKAWTVADGLALGYRWYKDNRYFGESKVRMPLGKEVASGASVNVNIGVATVDMQDQPLADGNYVVRFELVRLKDGRWLSSQGAQPFWYPLTVGKPEPKGATFLQCSIPTLMAAGKSYPATVSVRNDTPDVWAKGTAKLGVMFRLSSKRSSVPAGPQGSSEVAFAKDCKPGEVIQIKFPVNLVNETGQPIEVIPPESPVKMGIVLSIYDGSKWLDTTNWVLPRIVPADNTARLVVSNLPAKVTVGKDVPVKLVLRNTGKTDWKKKVTFVGYHLYHLDGSELLWEGEKTPLKADLPAGMPVVAQATFKAPPYDGKYIVVWDVYANDTWLSTLPMTRGGDQLLNVVEVTGGKLVFVDLGATADVPMSSPESSAASGDFDGKGASFPGEWVPPEISQGVAGIAPSEYNLGIEPNPQARISFLYNTKEPLLTGAVKCNRQKIDVPKGKYSAVYVLAASVDGSVKDKLGLVYGETTVEAEIEVSDWGAAPKEGEVVGLYASRRRGSDGDKATQTCRLFSYKILADAAADLSSIVTPGNGSIRIAAITLEKAQ